MRLPNNNRFAFLYRGIATFALAAGLSACGTFSGGPGDSPLVSAPPVQRANGPSADYPITIGDPYFVNGTEYIPTDTLNYDHVGYLTVDQNASGYSGSHHTLPIPSYVEVTSLESGRTILVRLENRGPMDSNDLIGLAPAALTQLGATAQTPVRVRRVNPPEAERFTLRAGEPAPLRMDTPQSLLTVLQLRIPERGAASLLASQATDVGRPIVEDVEVAASEVQASQPVSVAAEGELPASASVEATNPATASAPAYPPVPGLPALAEINAVEADASDVETGEFAAAFAETAEPEPVTSAAEAAGNFVIQAAAFSTEERANRAATALNGYVVQAGRYWRVRTGPFTTRGEAEASLANVRRAGYSDARIVTSG